MDLLSDNGTLLAVSTFIGSIAIFTDYLVASKEKFLGGKDVEGVTPFISQRVSGGIVFFHYLSVFLVWVNIFFLLLFSSPSNHPRIYQFITSSLLFSVFILTSVILMQWFHEFLDGKFYQYKFSQLDSIGKSEIDDFRKEIKQHDTTLK